MDKLKEEIAKKKLQLSQIKNLSQNGLGYITQKNLSDSVFDEKLREQATLDESRKRKQSNTESTGDYERKRNAQDIAIGEKEKLKAQSETIDMNLSLKEINDQLRLQGQPITLFGESLDSKRDRLMQLLKGDKNDTSNQDDNVYRLQNKKLHNNPTNSSSYDNGNDEDDEADDDEDISESESVEKGSGKNSSKKSKVFDVNELIIYTQIPNLSKEKLILKYFKSLLKIWEHDLKTRDENLKLSAKGKMETKLQKQCKDYIRPLFKLCKRKEVNYDILISLADMVKCCEEGIIIIIIINLCHLL